MESLFRRQNTNQTKGFGVAAQTLYRLDKEDEEEH
jgi:hypothetical protein